MPISDTAVPERSDPAGGPDRWAVPTTAAAASTSETTHRGKRSASAVIMVLQSVMDPCWCPGRPCADSCTSSTLSRPGGRASPTPGTVCIDGAWTCRVRGHLGVSWPPTAQIPQTPHASRAEGDARSKTSRLAASLARSRSANKASLLALASWLASSASPRPLRVTSCRASARALSSRLCSRSKSTSAALVEARSAPSCGGCLACGGRLLLCLLARSSSGAAPSPSPCLTVGWPPVLPPASCIRAMPRRGSALAQSCGALDLASPGITSFPCAAGSVTLTPMPLPLWRPPPPLPSRPLPQSHRLAPSTAEAEVVAAPALACRWRWLPPVPLRWGSRGRGHCSVEGPPRAQLPHTPCRSLRVGDAEVRIANLCALKVSSWSASSCFRAILDIWLLSRA